jgi:Transposase DDE domain
VVIDKHKKLTELSQAFLHPSNSTHRQYEALRAFFVDNVPSREVAHRFGYSPGSFRVLVHGFRQNPSRLFFLPPAKGPKTAPKSDPVREQIVQARKQNLSIYDIRQILQQKGHPLSPAYIGIILKEEGFARLPRRADEERPAHPHPEKAPVADVQQLDLSSRQFRTQFGGLFLFIPYLTKIDWNAVFAANGFPGSKMIPAAHAIRSLLGLKLYGTARHSHVMSEVFDPGLALFAGLNCIPKRAFLTEYSCRIAPQDYSKAMRQWFDAMKRLGLPRGESFDLDFHTIPFHGEDALLQKHYVSRRSRRQKGVLAFVAQDSGTHVFCYGNAQGRKENQNDEVLEFVRFWKERTKKLPQELIFDSKLTTYGNLDKLDKQGIEFITLRRRSHAMLEELRARPESAWRQIHLEGVSRVYRDPRVIDQRIQLSDYEGDIRQIIVKDLGHEEPTFLLSNQLHRSAPKLIERYARRMTIENSIQDGIDFFHMDALSSAVPMKVDCDLQLTLMGSSLYRLLGLELGQGYESAKSRTLFRDFVDAHATVDVGTKEVTVRFQKRAHNPLLLKAGFDKKHPSIPWFGNKKLHLVFG